MAHLTAVATPIRRAAVYVRISRDRAGGGLGVARQQADCAALAERMGITIPGEPYVDNDLSAYSGKPRPGYRAMLGAIEAGHVDTVLVWHTDRLHRSPAELEQWITACEPRGVEVHTVKAGPIDLATPSGRMIARQLGAVARYESEHRAERAAAKRDEIARDGGFLGGSRPFGYTRNGLELVPAEADLIADATDAILRGATLRTVVAMFNERGLPTTRAKQAWTPVAVREVLKRGRNAAKLVHRGVVVGDARWPAVVGVDEWRGVSAVLDNPARRSSPGNRPRWLGSGLYLCGLCGGPLVVGTTGAKRAPSYTCRAYRERPGARHVTRAAAPLDAFVTSVLVRRLSTPDAIDLFTQPTVPSEELDAIRNELNVIGATRDGLGVRLGRGEVTMAQFDAANAGMAERQRTLEGALASVMTTSPVSRVVQSGDVAAAWAGMALEIRRAVLAELLVVTVHPAPRGRRPGGGYFDPASVELRWGTA